MKKVKHHIIPRCYLDHFIDNSGFLNVLDLKEQKIFTTKPSNIFVDNHFFTIKFPGGGGSLIVENTLASIESGFSMIFRSTIQKKKHPNRGERALISIFIAAMMVRTRSFRNNLEDFFKECTDFIGKLESMTAEQKAHFSPVIRPSKSSESISGDEFKKVAKDVPSFHSSTIIEMLPEISNIIFNMKWAFLITPKTDPFITSDNPCALMNVPAIKKYGPHAIGSNPGLLQEEVDLTLPLSSEVSLLAGWKLQKESYVTVPKKMVLSINNRTAMYASEKIISNTPILLEDYRKHLKPKKDSRDS